MAIQLGQERERAVRALDNLLARIEEAQRDLEQAQKQLEGLFPMRVVWKQKTCGKAHCRCARGLLHGPYAYLIEHKDGRREETYLGPQWSAPPGMVRPERYRRLMAVFKARRERLEGLLKRLEQAVEVMRGWS